MKLLYFTDSHIRGTNPKNRLDNFMETLEKKFIEIAQLVEENKIDFVLHGGDLFDRPDTSISIASKFIKILNKIKVPIYLVSGNHDIYGHNPSTINRTMLGLLDTIGVIRLIGQDDRVILEKDNIKVQVTGSPYIYDIDSSHNKDNYLVKKIESQVNYSIHLVHGMLLDKPFIKGVPFTLVDDIKDSLADITLSGHYHAGFKTIKIDDKYFINPGSMVRISNSLNEMERSPKVVVIELSDKIDIKEITLKSALPGNLVLDRDSIEKSLFKGERILEFKESIDKALDFEKMDMNEVLMEVSTAENVEEKVIKEALKRIAISQMKDLDGD